MSQISFRGYAREKGFDPVKVPDSTRKIAQRDAAYMEGMERVNAGQIRNRERYQQGLERKSNLEQRNRDQNFSWAQSEQQRYNQGVLRNIEIEGQKYQSKQAVVGQQAQQALQQFSGLSKIAADTITGIAEQQAKNDEVAGMMLVYEGNINPVEWTEYQQQKAALQAGDTEINGVVNKMEADGAPPSILDQIHGLKGWKRYGAMAALAQQGGAYYTQFTAEARANMEFDTPDGSSTFTLATATTPAQRKAAMAGIRAAYLENFRGINPMLLQEHLFPKMQRFEADQFSEWSNQYEKETAARIEEERVDGLLTELSLNNGAGAGQRFLDWIESSSAGDKNARKRFRDMGMTALKEAVDAGYPGAEEIWSDIKETPMTIPGSNKTTTIGEYWRLQGGNDIDDAIDSKRKEAYQKRQLDKTLEKEKLDNMITEFLATNVEPLSKYERDSLIKKYQDVGLQPPDILLRTPVAEELEQEEEVERIESLIAMNPALLTTEWLIGSGFSVETVNKFLGKARDGDKMYGADKGGEVGQAMKIITAELASRHGAEIFADGSSKNPEYEWARLQAQRIFQEKYALAFKRDPSSALDVAVQATMTAIQEGWKGQGGVFNRTDSAKTGKPAKYLQMGQITVNGEVAALTRKFDQNPGLLSSEVFLTGADEIRQVLRLRNREPGGKIPDRVMLLSQSIGVDPISIINAQLKAMGEPGLLEVTSSQVLKSLRPEVQRILTYRPSLANTYQGFTMNNPEITGIEAYRPLLDLIASKESTSYGGYDAINRGGSDDGHVAHGSANSRQQYSGGISNMTVQQVMDLQRVGDGRGRLHATGRYQIIQSTLKGLIDGAYGPTGVNPTDKYDAATQDKLALALIRHRAGKFFDGNQSLDNTMVGMGNEWRGLRPRHLEQRILSQALIDTKGRLAAVGSSRSAEELRPNVVMGLSQMGKQVSSFRKETAGANFQPGIDLFFEDKQFRSPLGGVVKDIDYDPGYGNYVVVEATDPRTGEKVDMLMSHIENDGLKVKVGDSVGQGQVVAQQGGAGRVRSADGTIASIDFLAPAPRGSRSMAPYRDWSGLADYIRKGMGV